jgi:hypothetical protein
VDYLAGEISLPPLPKLLCMSSALLFTSYMPNEKINRSAAIGWIALCTTGMGVILWGASLMYVNLVNKSFDLLT